MDLRVGRAHALNAKRWFPLWRNARCRFIGMLPCMFVTMQKSSQKAGFLASGEFSKKEANLTLSPPQFPEREGFQEMFALGVPTNTFQNEICSQGF